MHRIARLHKAGCRVFGTAFRSDSSKMVRLSILDKIMGREEGEYGCVCRDWFEFFRLVVFHSVHKDDRIRNHRISVPYAHKEGDF